jgi:hypothetical protein
MNDTKQAIVEKAQSKSSSNSFFKAFTSERFGELLLMVNCDHDGNDVLQLYANPPSIGICHLEIPLDETLSIAEIYRDFIQAMSIVEVEELAEEIFEMDDDIEFN